MADSYKLTDLTTEIELVYNASTQPYYTAVYGASVDTPEPRAMWHQADGYPAELVDLVDGNRTAFFEFHVRKPSTGDIDDVLDKVAVLRRLVNQAARYSLDGDAKRVYLKVQVDGATNATLIPVVYGFVDDGAAFHNAPSRVNDIAFGAALMLTLEPYGQAASAITLKNYLLNPGFQAPSSGGVAAGWNIPGSGTGTVTESGHLLGTRRQNFTATGSGDLFQNAVNIVADATSAVAYIWCRILSGAGTWTLILYDVTATTDRATTTFSAANIATVADKTAKDAAGNTWYRIVVSSGSVVGGNAHRLRVRAGGADAIALNAAYLQFGVMAAPPAWSSYHQLQNRADTSVSNPERINYLDVWGVPGDAPALLRMKMTKHPLFPVNMIHILGTRRGGRYPVGTAPYFLDANNATVVTGSWTTMTGDVGSHGNWRQLVGDGNSHIIYWFVSGDALRALAKTPCRVFVRIGAGDAVSTAAMYVKTADGASPLLTWPAMPIPQVAAGGFSRVDLGLLNLSGLVHPDGPGTGGLVLGMTLTVTSAVTCYVDGIFLMPASPLTFVDFTPFPESADEPFWFDGTQDAVVWRRLNVAHYGSIPTITPGAVATRIHNVHWDDGPWELIYGDPAVVELEIYPRTRHLLGTA